MPIDLYKSHSTKFRIEDGKLRPPFASMAGLGPIAAESIYNAALQGEFECIDDLQAKAKLGKSAIELLQTFHVLDGMTQSNQMSLFV